MSGNRRILYLDCFSGISGDMFFGALLDLGASEQAIRDGLAKLPVSSECRVDIQPAIQRGITGTSLSVHLIENHSHSHDHDHAGRNYLDICQMIENAGLKVKVAQLALSVFKTIGSAEAAVHGIDLEAVHFHEVGAVDSIVDIVGAALALEDLGIDEIVCSTISDGSGTIQCQHGIIPVPVPAVVKMLEGSDIPYRSGTSDTELVTPTGMGLVKTICRKFGPMPDMKIIRSGYGFGKREIGRLNALRAILGESAAYPEHLTERDPFIDEVLLLSCNLDNSTPEQLGYAAERLMQAGALDVAFEPLMMKKWRPGQLLMVVAPIELENLLVRLIFELTGTIGIRRQITTRHVMKREIRIVDTVLGPVRFKYNSWHDYFKAYPEQADLIRAAEQAGISLQEAERLIRDSMD